MVCSDVLESDHVRVHERIVVVDTPQSTFSARFIKTLTVSHTSKYKVIMGAGLAQAHQEEVCPQLCLSM